MRTSAAAPALDAAHESLVLPALGAEARIHTIVGPLRGGVAVLYGKPTGVHITLNDLWENGCAERRRRGGLCPIAIGAPQADPGGRANAGSVWLPSWSSPGRPPP